MAAGKFLTCLPLTLKEEGGESNNPRDAGGHTNRGVTQARFDKYRASKGLQPRSVSSITDAELEDVYRTGYWDAIGAESLRPGEDLSGFDYAVNSGPAKACSTLAKAKSGAPPLATVIDNIATARLSFLHGLTTWQAFGKGWGARVARIEAASLTMANLPIAPNVASAKAKGKAGSAAAKASAVAAAPAAAGAHQFVSDSLWVLGVFVAAVCVGVAIVAFNAWRQSQRATALTAAASDLAAQTAATAAQAATAPKPAPAIAPKA